MLSASGLLLLGALTNGLFISNRQALGPSGEAAPVPVPAD